MLGLGWLGLVWLIGLHVVCQGYASLPGGAQVDALEQSP